jgi:hypothetical protein
MHASDKIVHNTFKYTGMHIGIFGNLFARESVEVYFVVGED